MARDKEVRTKSVLELAGPSFGLLVIAFSAMSAGAVQAREPTKADKTFCERYAEVMQKALDVDRSGDPVAINRFRQSVTGDPQAYLLLPGLGVSLTTAPWVTDVRQQSREHCLDQVRQNRRGFLPNDPERPEPVNTAESYVIRMPLQGELDPHAREATESVSANANAPGGAGDAVREAELIEKWWVAQNACYDDGDPDSLVCARRDHATESLEARGYVLHNRNVWTSRSDGAHFNSVAQSTNKMAKTLGTSSQGTADAVALQSLRRHVEDDEIIALWNDSRDALRDEYPMAWIVFGRVVKKIEADHADENDPRYDVDY